MNIVFCKPTTDFPSYRDFFRLAALSGFETRTGTINRKENELYVSIFHYLPDFTGCGGKHVIWFLERPSTNGGIQNLHQFVSQIKESRHIDEVWVSDRAMWNSIKDISKFVPVGSHENLSPRYTGRDYDVADFCYRSGRRWFIFNLQCKVAPLCYAPQRDSVISRSAFLLNVHQDEDGFYEPLRFALAVSTGIPVITEKCTDPFPYDPSFFVESSYQDLTGVIYRTVSDNYESYGKRAQEMRRFILSNFSFRTCVTKAAGE